MADELLAIPNIAIGVVAGITAAGNPYEFACNAVSPCKLNASFNYDETCAPGQTLGLPPLGFAAGQAEIAGTGALLRLPFSWLRVGLTAIIVEGKQEGDLPVVGQKYDTWNGNSILTFSSGPLNGQFAEDAFGSVAFAAFVPQPAIQSCPAPGGSQYAYVAGLNTSVA